MIGARCQHPRVGQRYFVSTKPNLTQDNIFDPQIICYQGKPNTSENYLMDYDLPCDLDEDAAWYVSPSKAVSHLRFELMVE